MIPAWLRGLLPVILASSALLCVACTRVRGGDAAQAVGLSAAFPALAFDQPVEMIKAPFPGSPWYLLEREGRVFSFADNEEASAATVVLDIRHRVDASSSGMGLLGMAFHPRWAQSFQAFLFYTARGARAGSVVSVLSRVSSADSGRTLDSAGENILLEVAQPYRNHKGGRVAFGPDGFLHLGLGDGGSAGDPQGNAQDAHSLLGKFLRIDVDRGSPYAVPDGNPYAGSPAGGRGEIFALGFRNPRRWSFDRATGELWAGDAGQGSWEEIDLVRAGGNYGWPIKEGSRCFSEVPCARPGLVDPVAEYGRGDGCAIVAGFVYRGRALPGLAGCFIYADHCSGKLWALAPRGDGGWRPRLLLDTSLRISAFAEDEAGELYALDYGTGRIYRLVPAAPAGNRVSEFITPHGRGMRERVIMKTGSTRPPQGHAPFASGRPIGSSTGGLLKAPVFGRRDNSGGLSSSPYPPSSQLHPRANIQFPRRSPLMFWM
jgi:glucose/arabinose dehydrogenase